jgi:hypothetical protein
MRKLTKENLKKLVLEALNAQVGYRHVPAQDRRELLHAPRLARKASKERWKKDLYSCLAKIQGDLDRNPEWNDGTQYGEVVKLRLGNFIDKCANEFGSIV